MGGALKDVLQGDDVGVLDSEEDRPKASLFRPALPLRHQEALFPHNAIRAQPAFSSLQKIGVKTVFFFSMTKPTVRTSERT